MTDRIHSITKITPHKVRINQKAKLKILAERLAEKLKRREAAKRGNKNRVERKRA